MGSRKAAKARMVVGLGRVLLGLFLWIGFTPVCAEDPPAPVEGAVRVATYNIAMHRDRAGRLRAELETDRSEQAKKIAEVLQRVRPDVVLLNEFDYEGDKPSGKPSLAVEFRDRYLARSQNGLEPLAYPTIHYYPVNTGMPSGFDLDRDGQTDGPGDAYGYGRYPGQYGMVLFARQQSAGAHTFTDLPWRSVPGALLPKDPATGASYYTAEELARFPLPSKGFWDCGVWWPSPRHGNRPIHLRLLYSHPTPPVFDGPEDRNGRRNYDEIGLIAKYASIDRENTDELLFADDNMEGYAAMPEGAPFVVLGDLNADPVDGESYAGAIDQLLKHPRINASFTPRSAGGVAAARRRPDLNGSHGGNPAHDTADFSGDGQGNLRVDYVLPSRSLEVVGSGVYWPLPGEPGAPAITASDHRLVWVDVAEPVPASDRHRDPR